MDITGLLQRVEALVTPILQGMGLELVEAEFQPGRHRAILRLSVDYPPGDPAQAAAARVTLDECARASRAMEGVLDAEAGIPMAYVLEVSSPGVDRPLKRPADFARYLGRVVEIRTREPLEGRAHFKGRLAQVLEDAVVVEIDRRPFTVRFDQMARARLKYFERV